MRVHHRWFVGAMAGVFGGLIVVGGSARSQSQERTTSPDSVAITPQRAHDSYVRTREVPPVGPVSGPPTAWGQETRTINGFGNNASSPTWGSAGARFVRLAPADYSDGVSTPAGVGRPSPRAVSNAINVQGGPVVISGSRSDFIWMWGQFLDHDLDLAATAVPEEPFDIPVPMGDSFFDPSSTGTQVIPLDRSAYDPASGTGMGNPREQVNVITSYIDASNVYGSDAARAAALRTNDGTGKLLTSAGELLPFNTGGFPNAGGPGPNLFFAGDVRSNEQVALSALHTLFVREHNRLAGEILVAEPMLSDEEVYQRARAIVGAQMQVITYQEWLPLLIGEGALPPYSGYNPAVDAGVSNLFATGCFRIGHTMLSPQLRRLDAFSNPIPEGHLPLRDAFFAPMRLVNEGGIEPLLRGGALQPMQEIDHLVIDDVRNFLFGPPSLGGLDLVSLNVQRGREHGLPSYNMARAAMGLSMAGSFAGITSQAPLQAAFASVYSDVNQVDVWIGAISEDHVSGAKVGPLIRAILIDQFTRARDGDRFWHELFFSEPLLSQIKNTRLADIIRRNTTIGSEIQGNVFVINASGQVPTVSTWGLIALSLLVLSLGTVLIRSRITIAGA